MSNMNANVIYSFPQNKKYLKILRSLINQDGIHLKDLAEKMKMQSRSISYRLNLLEECQYIFRVPDITDLRSNNIFINPKKRKEIRMLLKNGY